jgi:hypothetical protein
MENVPLEQHIAATAFRAVKLAFDVRNQPAEVITRPLRQQHAVGSWRSDYREGFRSFERSAFSYGAYDDNHGSMNGLQSDPERTNGL